MAATLADKSTNLMQIYFNEKLIFVLSEQAILTLISSYAKADLAGDEAIF